MDFNHSALRDVIVDQARQIMVLQAKIAELERSIDVPAIGINTKKGSQVPSAPQLPPYPEDCNCRCCSHMCSPSTRGHGVYLGLVRAADVVSLSEHALKVLDDGLKEIAQHLVPRGAGAPAGTSTAGPLSRARDEMIVLLDKVSLRVYPLPGGTKAHFAAFRDPSRGRCLRLGNVRLAYFALIPEGYRTNGLYFETFVQLLHFRGIDVEGLP